MRKIKYLILAAMLAVGMAFGGTAFAHNECGNKNGKGNGVQRYLHTHGQAAAAAQPLVLCLPAAASGKGNSAHGTIHD